MNQTKTSIRTVVCSRLADEPEPWVGLLDEWARNNEDLQDVVEQLEHLPPGKTVEGGGGATPRFTVAVLWRGEPSGLLMDQTPGRNPAPGSERDLLWACYSVLVESDQADEHGELLNDLRSHLYPGSSPAQRDYLCRAGWTPCAS